MSELHILRPASVKEEDNLSIAGAKKKLKPCPICGADMRGDANDE